MEYDLVFEGGGAKGMVFVGAMQEFEQRGHTYKRLLGTSAGAITAALLAAGYTASEMLSALGEQEEGRSVFTGFMAKPGPFERSQVMQSATLAFLRDFDIPLIPEFIEKKLDERIVQWLSTDPRLASAYSLLEFGGWYSADRFIAWLKRRLDSGFNRGKPRAYSGMTLAEFYEETRYDLSVVASDTTGGAMLVLNHRTAPGLPLVWAVRMSMSIPLLWQEVVWQPAWGQYRGKDIAGHAIVDGGILSNFPIALFVSRDDFVKNLMGPDAAKEVLGMVIDESLPVMGEQPASASVAAFSIGQLPLLRRITDLVNTTLGARDKLVSEAFEKRVVRLPAKGYGTTEFDMPDDKRSRLVTAGLETMKSFLDALAAQQEDLEMLSFDTAAMARVAEEEARALKEADKTALKLLQ